VIGLVIVYSFLIKQRRQARDLLCRRLTCGARIVQRHARNIALQRFGPGKIGLGARLRHQTGIQARHSLANDGLLARGIDAQQNISLHNVCALLHHHGQKLPANRRSYVDEMQRCDPAVHSQNPNQRCRSHGFSRHRKTFAGPGLKEP
jgi:hypothetical protein